MTRQQYLNANNSQIEEVRGSDGRADVSARADGRGYYNSRDEGESFSLVFNDDNCSVGDYVVYIKNTKTDGKHMVIRSASANSDSNSAFEFVQVSGDPGGGAVAATPFNLNPAKFTKAANVSAFTVIESDVSPISGLTDVSVIDHINILANGHQEFRFQDQLRLGENQAIAIKNKIGTNASCFGIIFFFFEQG